METAEPDEFFLVVVGSSEDIPEQNEIFGLTKPPQHIKEEPPDVHDFEDSAEVECEIIKAENEEIKLDPDSDWEPDEVIDSESNEEHILEDDKDLVNQFLQSMQEQDKKVVKLTCKPYVRTVSGLYQCKYCQITSVNEMSILKHYSSRHCDNGYKCLACQRLFKRKDTLLHHEVYCSDENSDLMRLARNVYKTNNKKRRSKKELRSVKSSCPICGKQICHNNMSSHLDVHKGTRRFMCTYCPSTFRANKTLKAHLNMHMSRRPYACDLCSKSYTSFDTLQAHKLDHRGKAYTCHHCGKGYKRKHRIVEHLQLHESGKGGYQCDKCEITCSSKVSLTHHLRTHRSAFPCTECNKKFKWMNGLIKHAKAAHGSLIITRKKFLDMLPQLVDVTGGTTSDTVTLSETAL